jgi:hypothetical protein
MVLRVLVLLTFASIAATENVYANVWQVGPCGRGGLCPGAYTPQPTLANTPTPNPSAPTPTPSATSTITRTPVPGAFELRLNVGGSSLTDGLGNAWVADTVYSPGGYGVVAPNAGQLYATDDPIYGSSETGIYQHFRQAVQSLHVRVDVPTGTYQVIFKFADFSSKAAGERVLTVKGQGVTLTAALTGLDLYALGGGIGQVHDFSDDIGVTGTALNLEIDASAGLALLNALEVRSLQALATATPTATTSPTPTSTATLNSTPIEFNLTLPPGLTPMP